MSAFRLSIEGLPALESELRRLNDIRFDAVVQKQVVQMLTRARAPGGTPVDTGELRLSLGSSGDEVGYTKDYAPHVEFGHRTKNGGWVEGQHFLKNNVDLQRPIYRQDLISAIKKG